MRYPAVAGHFYPEGRESLASAVRSCFTHPLGPGLPGESSGAREIVGAVAPHAGYMASGMNAAHTFKAIAEDGLPEAYVIIGPDHRGIPFPAALCSDPYLTPLGACEIHTEILGKLSETVVNSPAAHGSEHSVEVQVPFIQTIDPDPRIVPIIMRDQSMPAAKRLAAAVRDACEGHDVIVLASSDLSHYVPKEVAAKLDGMVMDAVSRLDVAGMYSAIREYGISACGYGPIAVAMEALSPKSADVLAHTDSWDALKHDRSAVVGYGSAVFRRR
ncbi:MAG: AmmeMemoRadiSam system protein B [Thermoplasmatales archaeon]|nr:AmmeMemoRadiSam system protein B [Thermoplasmatales archaeon]